MEMQKLNQTVIAELPAPQAMEEQTPQEDLVCTIRFISTTFFNGHTRVDGTIMGGIAHHAAKKLEQLRVVEIVGSPQRTNRPERDLNAIENQTPAGLNPEIWHPACPVVGQKSAVFVNMEEVREIQNR
jgi:hypothetical protein